MSPFRLREAFIWSHGVHDNLRVCCPGAQIPRHKLKAAAKPVHPAANNKAGVGTHRALDLKFTETINGFGSKDPGDQLGDVLRPRPPQGLAYGSLEITILQPHGIETTNGCRTLP